MFKRIAEALQGKTEVSEAVFAALLRKVYGDTAIQSNIIGNAYNGAVEYLFEGKSVALLTAECTPNRVVGRKRVPGKEIYTYYMDDYIISSFS